MKRIIFYIALFSFGLCSCFQENVKKKNNNDTLSKETFRLSVSPININEKDSLILAFYKTKFKSDTSLYLAAFKRDSFVLIKLHEVTPQMIAENTSMHLDTMYFAAYNGYTCKLKLSLWNDIINKTGLDTYIVRNNKRRELLDGGSYSLYFKSKIIWDSDEDLPFLIKTDKILSECIIDKINYRAQHTPSKFDEESFLKKTHPKEDVK